MHTQKTDWPFLTFHYDAEITLYNIASIFYLINICNLLVIIINSIDLRSCSLTRHKCWGRKGMCEN